LANARVSSTTIIIMKKISSIVLGSILVFSFAYGLVDKSENNKLQCKICDGTYFKTSIKIKKFVGEDSNRILKFGSFYQCVDCGHVTDVKVK